MVRKKGVKKTRSSGKSSPVTRKLTSSNRKVDLVVKNLVVFVILFVISLGLYFVSSNELLLNFFWIVALISGLIFVAFLIAYLALFFMKYFKR